MSLRLPEDSLFEFCRSADVGEARDPRDDFKLFNKYPSELLLRLIFPSCYCTQVRNSFWWSETFSLRTLYPPEEPCCKSNDLRRLHEQPFLTSTVFQRVSVTGRAEVKMSITSGFLVIRPGSMPSAAITAYKPTSRF